MLHRIVDLCEKMARSDQPHAVFGSTVSPSEEARLEWAALDRGGGVEANFSDGSRVRLHSSAVSTATASH